VLETIPTVDSVIPVRELPLRIAYTGNANVKPVDGRLVGCTPEYAEINKLKIDRGHFLTHPESKSTVCVIAARLAEKLFPYEDPIKKKIYIPEKNERYEIVGVEAPERLSSDLITQCYTAFNNPVHATLSTQEVDGKVVLVVKVSEARCSDKPIYLKSKGLPYGAYRRVGASDQTCTDFDLDRLYQLRSGNSYDSTIVDQIENFNKNLKLTPVFFG